jgi:hypothetical protein
MDYLDETNSFVTGPYKSQFYSTIYFNDALSITDTQIAARKRIGDPNRK